MRKTENPRAEVRRSAGGDDETVYTHPAYAMIGAYRTQGAADLHGSDFRHQSYITVRICRSELHRNLAHDWHYGREEIVEVALSEAQWATFVSSMNVGSGVPCTLQRERGALTPALPPRNSGAEYTHELEGALADTVARLRRLEEKVHETTSGMTKSTRETLLVEARLALKYVEDRVPFIRRQQAKHMEEQVEKAKVETHGYVTGLLSRMGLASTRGRAPAIEKPQDHA